MSKIRFGLGKGLDALIPTSGEEERVSVQPTPETRDDGVSTGILAHIEVNRITPNPYQPRADFERQSLLELAQSIQENGLVQPITVRRHEGGYQLISGERRVRACQEAGIQHIPAYIRHVETVEEMIELALIENIQRETLNPIEIARGYQMLIDDCRFTQEMIAAKVGKNRATVANFVRLLKLPRQIQESIQKDEISMGHARALINVPGEPAQLRIWKKIVRDGLSVRAVEQLARNAMQPGATAPKKRAIAQTQSVEIEAIVEKLRPIFGTKIHIEASRDGKGSIRFDYYSHEDFERILELLLSARG